MEWIYGRGYAHTGSSMLQKVISPANLQYLDKVYN
jgi:hypothetical protein